MSDPLAAFNPYVLGRRLLHGEALLKASGRRGERDPIASRYLGAPIPNQARPGEVEEHVEAQLEEPHPWRRWTGPPR